MGGSILPLPCSAKEGQRVSMIPKELHSLPSSSLGFSPKEQHKNQTPL